MPRLTVTESEGDPLLVLLLFFSYFLKIGLASRHVLRIHVYALVVTTFCAKKKKLTQLRSGVVPTTCSLLPRGGDLAHKCNLLRP